MAFDGEQRGIVGGVVPAALISLAAILLAAFTDLFGFGRNGEIGQYTLLALLGPALALIHAVGRVANHRFAEPLDRNAAAAGTKTERIDILQAILRNTHEQATIALLVYAIAINFLLPLWYDAVLYCGALFLLGRVAFTLGYERGAAGRAFGFGLTFYPSVMLLILTLVSAIG